MSFDARLYLKEIARGKHGARNLTREQARTLFSAIFAGEVPEAALGAILVALRIKTETAAEIAGMMDALAPHVEALRFPMRRAQPVLIPSYNGARKLPNLVPLLALLLAREGVPVLVHGAAEEAQRVSTFEILAHLGHHPVNRIEEAGERLAERLLAPVPIAVLSPALARLLERRREFGLRNSGHSLAKLLLPAGVSAASACRLVAVTHPDFLALLKELLAMVPANVFLMRGVEGEAVMRLHAPQPIEQVTLDGQCITHVLGDGEPEPALPARDSQATAQWTHEVLLGKIPVPLALARQVALIASHCRESNAKPDLKLVPASR
jgi:anthranilate phosphoribosyltransferase